MRLRARKSIYLPAALAGLLALGACTSPAGEEPGGEAETAAPEGEEAGGENGEAGGVVRVVSHDSFNLEEELFAQFTETTGYELEFSAPGDAGALVNQLILTKDSPLGDVVYGIDNSFAARAIDAEILEDYAPAELPGEAADYLIDGGNALTPIDLGDVCLNVDHEWFDENDLPEPEDFDDLLNADYEGLTVLTNPAQSSPGLAFLLATISNFDGDWVNYWDDLLANDVKIVDGWSDAYYTDFTANGGSRPIALSYSTSPAFTLDDDGDSTTGSLLDTCFRQVEYAGVLAGAENPEGARAFVDFLLSEDVQGEIAESLYMYPVAPVDLPEDWVAHAPLAEKPHQLDPADIEANLDDWLRTWQDDVIG